jgi:hypothetical protein
LALVGVAFAVGSDNPSSLINLQTTCASKSDGVVSGGAPPVPLVPLVVDVEVTPLEAVVVVSVVASVALAAPVAPAPDAFGAVSHAASAPYPTIAASQPLPLIAIALSPRLRRRVATLFGRGFGAGSTVRRGRRRVVKAERRRSRGALRDAGKSAPSRAENE